MLKSFISLEKKIHTNKKEPHLFSEEKLFYFPPLSQPKKKMFDGKIGFYPAVMHPFIVVVATAAAHIMLEILSYRAKKRTFVNEQLWEKNVDFHRVFYTHKNAKLNGEENWAFWAV